MNTVITTITQCIIRTKMLLVSNLNYRGKRDKRGEMALLPDLKS